MSSQSSAFLGRLPRKWMPLSISMSSWRNPTTFPFFRANSVSDFGASLSASRTGCAPPGRPRYRREPRGSNPMLDHSGLSPLPPHKHRTNPDTIPIRSRACRKAPRRSASSRLPGASSRRSFHRTIRIRQGLIPGRQSSSTDSCFPPGRRIATELQSAMQTCRLGRLPLH